jgi:quinol-cytochrome oxidoreductase complex cytochrome b subunit
MAPINRFFAFLAILLTSLCVLYLAGGSNWIALDLRAGSPVGQSIGIFAGIILLATLFYVPLRRSDPAKLAKPSAQTWHALTGIIGTTLAVLHSHAALREWSTLVLLAILGLLITGLYGRLIAPLRVGSAFGRSAVPYANTAQTNMNESNDLIQKKQTLLKSLAADSREEEFVLRWCHWKQNPRQALNYYRLVLAERRLLTNNPYSASANISVLERCWRRLHLLLAVFFIVGIFAHVFTTVFFASYVADGRDVYWWHLTQW